MELETLPHKKLQKKKHSSNILHVKVVVLYFMKVNRVNITYKQKLEDFEE